ncbi:hypothetical protein LT493_15575 [Streptomyces tricolor]|nr:hypothetical protein [Streptomyces tricolor]
MEPPTPPVRSAGYDLAFDFVETDGGLTGHLEYNTGLFDADTAERLAARLRVPLEAQPPRTPRCPWAGCPLMTGAERRQVPPVRAQGRPAARADTTFPPCSRPQAAPHPAPHRPGGPRHHPWTSPR